MIKWTVLGAAALGAVIVAGNFKLGDGLPETADPDNRSQVEIGRAVYAANCTSCHGANLEGQPKWQTPLQTGGLPAPRCNRPYLAPSGRIVVQIHQIGRAKTGARLVQEQHARLRGDLVGRRNLGDAGRKKSAAVTPR
jgi:hypothetical protein